MKRLYILLSPLLLLLAHLGLGQSATMSLMGNVQSDDRKALAGAVITVVHVPSGARYSAASSSAGIFSFNNLQAGGPYLMRVGEAGYRPQTLESIFLEKGKTANFTVTLSRLLEANKGRSTHLRTTETLAAESGTGVPTPPTHGSHLPRASSGQELVEAGLPMSAGAAPASPTAPYKRYPRRAAQPIADPIVPGHFDAKSGNYIYETGRQTTLKLANGQVVADVGINSTESNLYRFLADPQSQVDTVDLTRGWYNFDRVYFNPGKATLTDKSIDQLGHVAAIMRAFPKSRIKLGGYTDSTGTYKVNKQLSDARAQTAWAALVELGISPSRIDAHGYGPRYAIAPNTTEEGRAMNRRLSVKVIRK